MKAIHAVNAVLWQPGEQILNLQTDKPNGYYTRGRPRAPRVKISCTIDTILRGNLDQMQDLSLQPKLHDIARTCTGNYASRRSRTRNTIKLTVSVCVCLGVHKVSIQLVLHQSASYLLATLVKTSITSEGVSIYQPYTTNHSNHLI